MNENNNFNAAIVNEKGIIENVLVFNSEEIMHDFGAKRLAPGQGIEEYNTLHKKEILLNEIQMAVDDI